MKIALVHDYLVQNGGAEKVLQSFCEIFPYAPIYTLVYDEDKMDPFFKERRIYTSSLQKLPFARKRHRLFPPFMPVAIEQFDLSKYDVVLSSSHSYAKGVITGAQTTHISYIHTPMRYAWDDCQKYTADFYFPSLIKRFIPFVMNYIRLWDWASAQRPDKIIANSSFIEKRISKYYQRTVDAVIHPPIETQRFHTSDTHDHYFLMVGRILPNKRFDIAVEAFNANGLPLKIIGTGPAKDSLKEKAHNNIEFLGRVSDDDLAHYYTNCRAFLFPQEEDFGIVAMEAFASGRPIIAYHGGDIVEHMDEGKTGILFTDQTADGINAAIRSFMNIESNCHSENIRARAQKFDKEKFKIRIKDYIDNVYVQR